VKGNIAAAIALEHFHTLSRQLLARCDYVRGFSVSPHCDYWGVFEEQKHVADPGILAQIDQPSL
jgi:hypothetical protein